MPLNGHKIRNMTQDELEIVLDWAGREGWNPGLRDAGPLYGIDPGGLWVGELDGEIVSAIACIDYGGFGFCGLHLVRKDLRGQGLGTAIWEHGLKRLEHLNVGLDGISLREEFYKQYGFRVYHRNVRYKWDDPPDPCVSERLIPIEEVPVDEIQQLDRECFPVDRSAFLHEWIGMANATGLAVAGGAGLRGYGVVRTCAEGARIGPLFADDCEAAEALLLGLGAAAEQGPVYIDMPEINSRAIRLAKQYGMTPCFDTVRMYTKGEPDIELYGVFGVTSFEIG